MNFQWMTRTAGRAKKLLLTAGLLFIVTNMSAQTADRINLSARQVKVSELFRQIEQQTGYVVVVKSDIFDNDRTITFSSMNDTLDGFLGQLLTNTDCGWYLSEGYITIGVRESPRPEVPTVTTTPGRIIIADNELRQFAPGAHRVADTIVRNTFDAGPMRFAVGDKTFLAPGTPIVGGYVDPTSESAMRWQRSKLALKSNLLYGLGTLTPNLRAELGLGYRTTLEAGLAYNGRNLEGSVENNRKLVHGIAIAEFRYWLCERFDGHFFGVHALGGFYNISGHKIPILFDKEYRYEGTGAGAGISYGYSLPLSPRWGVEFNVGVGVARLKYDKYGCDKCDELEGRYNRTYLGPTRAAINLVFIIK
jgi:hypothetical protein